MLIREFLDALRSTQGQHTLASVLEGPESGARLLLCEGVPVWPARPEGLLARNLPALAGCGASGILTLENKRVFVWKNSEARPGSSSAAEAMWPSPSSGWP